MFRKEISAEELIALLSKDEDGCDDEADSLMGNDLQFISLDDVLSKSGGSVPESELIDSGNAGSLTDGASVDNFTDDSVEVVRPQVSKCEVVADFVPSSVEAIGDTHIKGVVQEPSEAMDLSSSGEVESTQRAGIDENPQRNPNPPEPNPPEPNDQLPERPSEPTEQSLHERPVAQPSSETMMKVACGFSLAALCSLIGVILCYQLKASDAATYIFMTFCFSSILLCIWCIRIACHIHDYEEGRTQYMPNIEESIFGAAAGVF